MLDFSDNAVHFTVQVSGNSGFVMVQCLAQSSLPEVEVHKQHLRALQCHSRSHIHYHERLAGIRIE